MDSHLMPKKKKVFYIISKNTYYDLMAFEEMWRIHADDNLVTISYFSYLKYFYFYLISDA